MRKFTAAFLVMSASLALAACGTKKEKQTAPDEQTGSTERGPDEQTGSTERGPNEQTGSTERGPDEQTGSTERDQ